MTSAFLYSTQATTATPESISANAERGEFV
jgi:hypothetical protein